MILRECTNLKRIPVSFLAEFVLKLPILRIPIRSMGIYNLRLNKGFVPKPTGLHCIKIEV
ncbi:hypothetical protein LEP1GSC187_0688 [Leptospira santarosai str. ZUN179]|uniref:Uncharacterized protein n=1 Tax=Leptospira santarosai str. ZUN179 TaxID=1049985 RepID=M6V9A0_9LEPT|nr:hypothetical protein LEP1GSC187_0688 [Leptospira santarosai str. ZUN179]